MAETEGPPTAITAPPARAPSVAAPQAPASTPLPTSWCGAETGAFCADFEGNAPFAGFENGACPGAIASFGLVPGSASSSALGIRGGGITAGCQPVIVRRVELRAASRARIAFDMRVASLGTGRHVPFAVTLPTGDRIVISFTADATTASRLGEGEATELASLAAVVPGAWSHVAIDLALRDGRWRTALAVDDATSAANELDGLSGTPLDALDVELGHRPAEASSIFDGAIDNVLVTRE